MRIGVPKEIKVHEYRVGLIPAAVRELVDAGHQVLVEANAASGIGFADGDYRRVGASIANTADEVFANSDARLAQRFGIGLHLRAEQLAAFEAASWTNELPLAASCHGAHELQQAERIGCTFAVLGSLRATPTHPGVAGIGWPGFAALREGVSLPLYAIGGLGPDDIAQARDHGAQGVAAIRSLWPSFS